VTTSFPPRRKCRVSDPTETINYTHGNLSLLAQIHLELPQARILRSCARGAGIPPDLSLRPLNLCAPADVLDDYAEACAKPAATA
jgi:hypothetical protein